jgi:hypothetical protein
MTMHGPYCFSLYAGDLEEQLETFSQLALPSRPCPLCSGHKGSDARPVTCDQ